MLRTAGRRVCYCNEAASQDTHPPNRKLKTRNRKLNTQLPSPASGSRIITVVP